MLALLAPLIVRTPRQVSALLRALIALAGLGIMLDHFRADGATTWIGPAYGLGSAIFFASTMCISKRLVARFTAEEHLVYHCEIAAVLLVPLAPLEMIREAGRQFIGPSRAA